MGASDEQEDMVSTIYRIHGASTDDDILKLRLEVSSYEEKVGGVSFERRGDGPIVMIIKHTEDVVLRDENVARMVAKAGPFTIESAEE